MDNVRVSSSTRIAPSVMLTNARSIVNKLAEIQSYINCHLPDIFVITESWLHSGISDDLVSFIGYHFLQEDRDKRGGGLIIYMKENIIYEVIECHFDGNSDVGAVYIPQFDAVLLSLYHPVWGNSLAHYTMIDFLCSMLSYISTPLSKFIINFMRRF